jgi:HSP20 family protein
MYFEFHSEKPRSWVPPTDVCERPTEIVIIVEMPGIDRADVKLAWHEGVLTISGHKRQLPDTGIAQYHCVERDYGHFRRDITISVPIQQENARAELRDGVMRIYLPKRTSKPESSEIPIT